MIKKLFNILDFYTSPWYQNNKDVTINEEIRAGKKPINISYMNNPCQFIVTHSNLPELSQNNTISEFELQSYYNNNAIFHISLQINRDNSFEIMATYQINAAIIIKLANFQEIILSNIFQTLENFGRFICHKLKTRVMNSAMI